MLSPHVQHLLEYSSGGGTVMTMFSQFVNSVVGVEIVKHSINVCFAGLKKCIEEYDKGVNIKFSNNMVVHSDATDAVTFDPCSTVFMFDSAVSISILSLFYMCHEMMIPLTRCNHLSPLSCTKMEPELHMYAARAFNASKKTNFLISFQDERRIIDEAGFTVSLVDQISVKMTGGEGKTCRFYIREGLAGPGAKEKLSNGEPCDPLLLHAHETILKGSEAVRGAIFEGASNWLDKSRKDTTPRKRKSIHESLGRMC